MTREVRITTDTAQGPVAVIGPNGGLPEFSTETDINSGLFHVYSGSGSVIAFEGSIALPGLPEPMRWVSAGRPAGQPGALLKIPVRGQGCRHSTGPDSRAAN